MKKAFFALFAILIIGACSKDDDKIDTPTIADFVGSWKVSETSTQTFGGSAVESSSYTGVSSKLTDSTFVVTENRTSSPIWAAGTWEFKPITSTRELDNPIQGKIGKYSEKVDTLNFSYSFGGPGFLYKVKEVWVKQ